MIIRVIEPMAKLPAVRLASRKNRLSVSRVRRMIRKRSESHEERTLHPALPIIGIAIRRRRHLTACQGGELIISDLLGKLDHAPALSGHFLGDHRSRLGVTCQQRKHRRNRDHFHEQDAAAVHAVLASEILDHLHLLPPRSAPPANTGAPQTATNEFEGTDVLRIEARQVAIRLHLEHVLRLADDHVTFTPQISRPRSFLSMIVRA